jgi:prevent-host-death family protein
MLWAMKTVNVHQAKTQLSSLLAAVEAGEDVVIARSGHPVARLTRYQGSATKRPIGIDDGRLRVADDFDTFIPPEFLAFS